MPSDCSGQRGRGSAAPRSPLIRQEGGRLGNEPKKSSLDTAALSSVPPGRPPVAFHLYVPRAHLLVVVFHRRANGDIGVYLHTPSLGDATAYALRHTRMLDLTERTMLHGRFDSPAW